jgi:pimeloyl-ACP methyl ester carboxylesterase
MEKHQINCRTSGCEQHALLLQYPSLRETSAPRRLLLLHGAGVPGEVTWTYVANYLHEWDEILIPDFAGMGRSRFLADTPPRLSDYVLQIRELWEALDWTESDIAGYSFGGMVAVRYLQQYGSRGLCFLLEPAMLFSADCGKIRQKADDYLTVADRVEQNPQDVDAYFTFLDSVSPQRARNDKVDRLTIARLQENAQGFAQALRAVSQMLLDDCATYAGWIAPWPGISFVGGLSHATMLGRHRLLAEQSADWQCHVVDNADHSLVFTKPRTIAKVMNERRQRG